MQCQLERVMTNEKTCNHKKIGDDSLTCDLPEGHEGQHQATVYWDDNDDESLKKCKSCGTVLGSFERDVCGPCRLQDPRFEEESDE